jgi:hypothetical protein
MPSLRANRRAERGEAGRSHVLLWRDVGSRLQRRGADFADRAGSDSKSEPVMNVSQSPMSSDRVRFDTDPAHGIKRETTIRITVPREDIACEWRLPCPDFTPRGDDEPEVSELRGARRPATEIVLDFVCSNLAGMPVVSSFALRESQAR